MKTAKIATLVFMLVIAFALAACGGDNGTRKTGGTGGASGGIGSSGSAQTQTNDATPTPMPDDSNDAAASTPGQGQGADTIPDAPAGAQGSSELMFGFRPEEFNGNVFVLIDNLTKKEMVFDRIQILRGPSENDLSVIGEITAKSELWNYFYLDEGAAGKGYWYLVRGVRNEGGIETYGTPPGPSWEKQPVEAEWLETKPRWYMGDGEYVRIDIGSLNNGGNISGGYSGYHHTCAFFTEDGAMSLKTMRNYNPAYTRPNPDSLGTRVWSDTDGMEKEWDYTLTKDDGIGELHYLLIVTDDVLEIGEYHVDQSRPSKKSYTIDTKYTVVD
jgi:hypothetical protein